MPLLRAHPLLKKGIVAGKAFGRRLAHGNLELQLPLPTFGPVRWGFAVFADLAKTWEPLSKPEERLQMDVGAGLRLGLVGQEGVLRIDGARGLRDGAFALSVAWQLSWPGWN